MVVGRLITGGAWQTKGAAAAAHRTDRDLTSVYSVQEEGLTCPLSFLAPAQRAYTCGTSEAPSANKTRMDGCTCHPSIRGEPSRQACRSLRSQSRELFGLVVRRRRGSRGSRGGLGGTRFFGGRALGRGALGRGALGRGALGRGALLRSGALGGLFRRSAPLRRRFLAGFFATLPAFAAAGFFAVLVTFLAGFFAVFLAAMGNPPETPPLPQNPVRDAEATDVAGHILPRMVMRQGKSCRP